MGNSAIGELDNSRSIDCQPADRLCLVARQTINISKNPDVVSRVVTLEISVFSKMANIPAEANAIMIGANPNANHNGFIRHRNHPANNRFPADLPSVTPATTTAARFGVQDATATNSPIIIAGTDARLTTTPIRSMAIAKNR